MPLPVGAAGAALRERQEWQFFAHLPRADGPLAFAWWALVLLRSVLPPVFAVATGAVIGAVQDGRSTTGSLVAMGVVFVALQVSAPLHQTVSESLGNRMSAWLYDDLTRSCGSPPGIGHLEDPTLAGDISVAREFDSGHHGPPMEVNLPFIATGLIDLGTGLASVVVLAAYTWWAPLVLGGAWGATPLRLLRELRRVFEGARNTDEVREASLHAEYAFRLAVDPPPPRSSGSSGCPTGPSSASRPGGVSCSTSSRPPRSCVSVRWC